MHGKDAPPPASSILVACLSHVCSIISDTSWNETISSIFLPSSAKKFASKWARHFTVVLAQYLEFLTCLQTSPSPSHHQRQDSSQIHVVLRHGVFKTVELNVSCDIPFEVASMGWQ